MNADPLLEVFFAEADELLADCEEALVALEVAPHDQDLLNRIFRMAHTLKSNSAMLGFAEISRLTHALEDLLDQLRQGNCRASRALIDVLLASKDLLRTMLDRARGGSPSSGTAETAEAIMAQLRAFLEEARSPAPAQACPEKTTESFNSSAAGEATEIELPRRRHSDGEEATSIRVPVDRIDRLINLVGELVIAQSIVSQTAATLTQDRLAEFREAVAQMDRHARDLHERIMSIRMVPVRHLFARFPRLVRDLTARTGKQATLDIRGEDTELDKTVIEKIADPIVHLSQRDRPQAGTRARARGPGQGGERLPAPRGLSARRPDLHRGCR